MIIKLSAVVNYLQTMRSEILLPWKWVPYVEKDTINEPHLTEKASYCTLIHPQIVYIHYTLVKHSAVLYYTAKTSCYCAALSINSNTED